MPKTYLGIKIEPETKRKLDIMAKKEKRTVSSLASNALDDLVKNVKEKKCQLKS